MEESEGGEVFLLEDCPISSGGGDGERDDRTRKKQKKSKHDSSQRLNNSDPDDHATGIIISKDWEVDEPLFSSIATAAICALENQNQVCRDEAGGSEIDGNGVRGRGDGKELRIQIPGTCGHLSETTSTTEDEEEEEDDGEGELIPEFDPDEKGNSLFTDELRAAAEEGSSELQLPPRMMTAVDSPRFSAHGLKLLATADESKEIANMNGGGRGLPFLPAAPSNGTEDDGIAGHLDAVAYKMYAALQQQASTYPPVGTTPRAEQEQDGDKNLAGIDEGERTPRHPRWSREETAVLLAGRRKWDEEIRALQAGSKFASATERWDSISNYCKAQGVDRDAHQCRKRWSNLAADFKKIRNWHKQSGPESYWSMRGDSRRKNKLPGSFDPAVYADMEASSDGNSFKRRKVAPPGPAEDVEEHQQDPLASILESSGRAMQAALAINIQAQIEAHNQNSELDRVQRKEQSDNLVGVLGLLAYSLGKIAERL